MGPRITFDREDMELLLPHLYRLREGTIPAELNPQGESAGRARGIQARATFERACQIAAEIDIRLARCGTDREYAESSYCDGITDEAIASRYHTDVWNVRRCIKAVMDYISSGECPRWLACSDCGMFDKCRKQKKGRKEYSYLDWKRYRVRR